MSGKVHGQWTFTLLLMFWLTVTVQGQRRFVVDGNSNLTTLVAKLATEVEELKHDRSISTRNITRLEEQVQQLRRNLSKANTDLEQAKNIVQMVTNLQGGASTYVRWGKSTCPGSDTELVYSGYVGGSNWDDSGAATNYLCLVKDPHLIGNASFNQGAQVFGAEYALDNGNWQATSRRLFQTDISFQDVPCAVCRTGRATVLMVPGKNTCVSGWTLEYEGLLSSGYYGHNAGSEFVCLDRNPETLKGGDSKQLGKLFYVSEAVCGSLKCPPYESGKDLTCAVCSK